MVSQSILCIQVSQVTRSRLLRYKLAIKYDTAFAGWVATEMGRQAGDGGMPAEKSAAGLAKVIEGLGSSKSGHFYDWSGEELPW